MDEERRPIESNDVEMEDCEEEHCVICSYEAPKRDKTSSNFLAMMNLYWQLMDIDVKPQDSSLYNLCVSCFDFLDEISDTNRALYQKLAPEVTKSRERIIDIVLEGIALRKKTDMPFLGIHSKLQAKHDKSTP